MHAPLASLALARARSERLKAIGLMLAAFFAFAVLDATAKYLGRFLDPLMVTWARYAFHLLLAFAVLNPLTTSGLFRTQRPGLQIFRALLLVVSTGLNFVALQYMQLAQTVSIQFAAPFLIAVLAGPLLGEWVRRERWAAIAVGFLGVLVVTRPGTDAFHPAMLLSLAGTACYALYNIITRKLAATDSPATLLILSGLVAVVATTPAVPFVWTWPESTNIWLLLGLTGALGGFGHYLLIEAHRIAPASVLGPFQYSQILWMVALGLLIFGDVPDTWTLLGSALVVGSGLYLIASERRAGP